MRLGTPLALLVAGCALALTGTAAAGTGENAAAPALSTAVDAFDPSALSPIPLVAPPGYVVATSPSLAAPAGVQTRGSIACPAGTVPFSGGASFGSSSLLANINSSFPNGTSWLVDVNNASPTAATFRVTAVCASAPARYQVVIAANQLVSPNDQQGAVVTCPRRTVPLGGGALVRSGNLAVNLNATYPSGGKNWQTDVNNATSASTTYDAMVVCGKKPGGYVLVSTGAANDAGRQTSATASCPNGKLPIGGGAASSSLDTSVSLNSTFPSTGGWRVFENNGSAGDFSVSAIALCAGV